LCARGERPSCRAGNQRYELAPSHCCPEAQDNTAAQSSTVSIRGGLPW
jgi:hypothetical protein